jgi:glycerophosphoryl diester phosphodiesterase
MSDIVVVRCPYADVALVEASHGAHRPVFVWGCTDIAEVRAMLSLGVEGLITDFADETAAEIARFEHDAA